MRRNPLIQTTQTPRDPRFIPVTGEYDAKRFHSQYGFLADMHKEELSTLKENLKRARKLLANSPRDLQEERAAEVERLERAVKRAESTVNKDRRERVEVEALSKVAREERERQKQGKKAWYMKDGASCASVFPQTLITHDGCSGQEGVAAAREVRRPRRVGGERCGAKGNREETKEDQPEGKEEATICCGADVRRSTKT